MIGSLQAHTDELNLNVKFESGENRFKTSIREQGYPDQRPRGYESPDERPDRARKRESAGFRGQIST